MPYVAPALRKLQESGGSAQETSSSGRSDALPPKSSFTRNRSFGDAGSYSRDSRDSRPPPSAIRRTPSSNDIVFEEWKPSERVQALNQEQIDEIRVRLNVVVEVPEGQPPAAAPIESFKDMNLHPFIIKDIAHHKYETPTPIQSQGIPIALGGRDILGCAETGSGKTAGFAIPMIQHCLRQPPTRPGDGPIGLVLAPTRELAQQIEKEVRAFSLSSSIKTAIVVGGVQMSEQKHDLRHGVEIVVATPGRFIDHLQQKNTSLGRISYVVLDEADRMLDMGFEPQIKEVLGALPPKHQTLLFSATMPPEIEELAQAYLKMPVSVKIGKVSTPTANVAQHLERTTENGKIELLAGILTEAAEQAAKGGPPMPLTIVFVERKTRCDETAEFLRGEGISAAALHGGLTQWERESALREFSAGNIRVLIATDVASRGLDVKGIGHVINMDLPRTFEDYVHRIGRTGRAGSRGQATSFYTDRDTFLVSQIKTALSELEKGNSLAFAAGKAARQQERQLAKEFKEGLKMAQTGMVTAGSAAIKLDEKYSHMANASLATAGSADAAWDD